MEAAQLMAAKRSDCVLVIDEEDHLSGIFTVSFVLYCIAKGWGSNTDIYVLSIGQGSCISSSRFSHGCTVSRQLHALFLWHELIYARSSSRAQLPCQGNHCIRYHDAKSNVRHSRHIRSRCSQPHGIPWIPPFGNEITHSDV